MHRRLLRLGAIALAALFWASTPVTAHVKYVTDAESAKDAIRFLVQTLSSPLNAAIIGGGAVGTLVAVVLYLRYRPFARDIRAVRAALREYDHFLPWMLRLSIGLPLVGAGYIGYLFTPVLDSFAPLFTRLFGLVVGFLLLFGLATRLVAGIGLLVYLVALPFFPELLLSFEYIPGFIGILLLGGGRPSADHVIGRVAADDTTLYSNIDPLYRRLVVPFQHRIQGYKPFLPTVLRLGLGVAFFYLGFSQKLMNPGQALAVVTKYNLATVTPIPANLWVVGAGLTEMVLGVTLALGLFTRASAGISFFMFTTTLFGLPDDPVLAHITLFGLTSALLVTGGGPFSLDQRIGARQQVERAAKVAAD